MIVIAIAIAIVIAIVIVIVTKLANLNTESFGCSSRKDGASKATANSVT